MTPSNVPAAFLESTIWNVSLPLKKNLKIYIFLKLWGVRGSGQCINWRIKHWRPIQKMEKLLVRPLHIKTVYKVYNITAVLSFCMFFVFCMLHWLLSQAGFDARNYKYCIGELMSFFGEQKLYNIHNYI